MTEADPRGGQPADADEHAVRPPDPAPSAEDAAANYLVNPFGAEEMDDAGYPAGYGPDVPEEERL